MGLAAQYASTAYWEINSFKAKSVSRGFKSTVRVHLNLQALVLLITRLATKVWAGVMQ